MRFTPQFPLPALSACLLLLAALAAGCSPTMRGSIALGNGDYAAALANYNEALAKDPDSLHIRQSIGLTYFTMKDYAKAEDCFKDILSRAPGQPEALFYLGLSRIGKGERQAALMDLTSFRWPFKFYHQKFVQEEAARLLKHPDLSADETIADLKAELEKGREEQRRFEVESEHMTW